MELYKPNGCCFCSNLKTGSLIIGWLTLIGSIGAIIRLSTSSMANDIDELENYMHSIQSQYSPKEIEDAWKQYAKEFQIEGIATFEEFHQELHKMDTELLRIWITSLIVSIIKGLFSSLHIHGVRKDRPGLILPFLMFIILSVLCLLLLAGYFLAQENNVMYPMVTNVTLGTIFMIAALLEIYFYHVIYAYYRDLKNALSNDHQIMDEELKHDKNNNTIYV